MKELELSIRIKNNRLLERREALGLSQHMMADVVGVCRNKYMDLENLRRAPVVGGRWRSDVLSIAEYFDCDPTELFPEALDQVREPVIERRLDAGEVLPLAFSSHSARMCLPAQELVDLRELDDRLGRAMKALSPRQRKILVQKHGLGDRVPMTFDQMGEFWKKSGLGASRERVRQIYETAMGKLRRVSDVLDGAPLPEGRRWVARKEEPPRGPLNHDFATVSDLLVDRPAYTQDLRRIWRRAIERYPGDVWMRVRLSDRFKNKVDLDIWVWGLSDSRERRDLEEDLRSYFFRLCFKSDSPPGTFTRGTPRTRLSRDARMGGFTSLGWKDKTDLRLAIPPGSGAPDEILRGRLWFCDRARPVGCSQTEVLWRPVVVGRSR